jgi:hypothetical protein
MRTTFVAAMVLVFCVPRASAQISTATLIGTVKDATGAVVAGARIEARNAATGASRNTATDGAGEYSILGLAAGRYTVTVSMAGFALSCRVAACIVHFWARDDRIAFRGRRRL